MTQEQIKALKVIVETIIEAVAASGPSGAPGGVLYAALMQYGASLSQFESLMSGLVKAGKLTKSGQLYFVA